MNTPPRQIRATYDENTITVYQAYSAAIAQPAVAAGRFVPPFKTERMTWIKPSFLWMMYRSGWATKPGQEHILAIQITRQGFEEALEISCLSHFDPTIYPDQQTWQQRKQNSSVRIQWDPERDINLNPLPWRSIQIGLSGPAVTNYINNWVTSITDITQTLKPGNPNTIPHEQPYPLPPTTSQTIGATQPDPTR